MIASLSGTVLKAGLDSVVLGVGGVGMLVHTTPATAASVRVGQAAVLETTLVVREDSLTLYGFATEDEKHVFETVQTVSGTRASCVPTGPPRTPRARCHPDP